MKRHRVDVRLHSLPMSGAAVTINVNEHKIDHSVTIDDINRCVN
jgi:hypothetical protein